MYKEVLFWLFQAYSGRLWLLIVTCIVISTFSVLFFRGSGAGGIRTLGTVLRPYNGLANHRLQPLGHSSIYLAFNDVLILCGDSD